MKINQFEDIKSWKKAKDLAVTVYKEFKDNKDYGFKDQIQRASVSIMNNIAEGFERGTNPEFRRFLFIAKGSCGEVRSMIYLTKSLNYLSINCSNKLLDETVQISKMLSGLIKTL